MGLKAILFLVVCTALIATETDAVGLKLKLLKAKWFAIKAPHIAAKIAVTKEVKAKAAIAKVKAAAAIKATKKAIGSFIIAPFKVAKKSFAIKFGALKAAKAIKVAKIAAAVAALKHKKALFIPYTGLIGGAGSFGGGAPVPVPVPVPVGGEGGDIRVVAPPISTGSYPLSGSIPSDAPLYGAYENSVASSSSIGVPQGNGLASTLGNIGSSFGTSLGSSLSTTFGSGLGSSSLLSSAFGLGSGSLLRSSLGSDSLLGSTLRQSSSLLGSTLGSGISGSSFGSGMSFENGPGANFLSNLETLGTNLGTTFGSGVSSLIGNSETDTNRYTASGSYRPDETLIAYPYPAPQTQFRSSSNLYPADDLEPATGYNLPKESYGLPYSKPSNAPFKSSYRSYGSTYETPQKTYGVPQETFGLLDGI